MLNDELGSCETDWRASSDFNKSVRVPLVCRILWMVLKYCTCTSIEGLLWCDSGSCMWMCACECNCFSMLSRGRSWEVRVQLLSGAQAPSSPSSSVLRLCNGCECPLFRFIFMCYYFEVVTKCVLWSEWKRMKHIMVALVKFLWRLQGSNKH